MKFPIRLFSKEKSDDFSVVEQKLKQTFAQIKEEFDDHKGTINQNTNEIQANYEYLCKLENKLDKLAERIDELSMFITQVKKEHQGQEEKAYDIPKLTLREQEVFLVLYASEGDLTYKEIARRTALTENLVSGYVTNLITKSVPLIKRYVSSVVYVNIDKEFKALQAKKNILKISQEISSDILY